MLIDTHCHLNFKAFKNREEVVIKRAKEVNVGALIVPGTDEKTSIQAVSLAKKYPSVYAAVGIHPHHTSVQTHIGNASEGIISLKKILLNKRIVAIGEVGLDLYQYEQTKYSNYKVTPQFIKAQQELFVRQINLSLEFNKALILHNRQAVELILPILAKNWDKKLENRTVFHCCEADERLLDFAIKHHVYIGVDGDLSWSRKKQRFIDKIPLNHLVLETDSPYLKPKLNNNWPKETKYPNTLIKEEYNEPKNIAIICNLVAFFKKKSVQEVEKQTTTNAQQLFNLN